MPRVIYVIKSLGNIALSTSLLFNFITYATNKMYRSLLQVSLLSLWLLCSQSQELNTIATDGIKQIAIIGVYICFLLISLWSFVYHISNTLLLANFIFVTVLSISISPTSDGDAIACLLPQVVKYWGSWIKSTLFQSSRILIIITKVLTDQERSWLFKGILITRKDHDY